MKYDDDVDQGVVAVQFSLPLSLYGSCLSLLAGSDMTAKKKGLFLFM